VSRQTAQSWLRPGNSAPGEISRTAQSVWSAVASLVVQGAWSVLLLFSGTFDMLTDTLIFVSWIFYAAGAYGVFVMQRKIPLGTNVSSNPVGTRSTVSLPVSGRMSCRVIRSCRGRSSCSR
jgi:hypothetical protein